MQDNRIISALKRKPENVVEKDRILKKYVEYSPKSAIFTK